MKPILFSIGSLDVYGYGLMYALSLIVGLFLAEYRAKKYGLDKDFLFNLGLFSILIGVLGAKLLHLITVFDMLIADFWTTLKNSISEGFVVYGGIIAAILFALFYCKKKKKNFLQYFDLAAPSIALGQAIGRIGCLFSGCCYGKEMDTWFSITFPEGAYAPAGVPLFPSQIISTILNLINFIILLIAYRKFKTVGKTAALYLINYGVGRFVIEFFRADYRGEVGIFSTSQFISLFVVAIGLVLMFYKRKSKTEDIVETGESLEKESNN